MQIPHTFYSKKTKNNNDNNNNADLKKIKKTHIP